MLSETIRKGIAVFIPTPTIIYLAAYRIIAK